MKLYGLLSIFCISVVFFGCGADKENQDILVARQAIFSANNSDAGQAKYAVAKKAIDSALTSVPDLIEAKCLKKLFALHSGSNWTTDIHQWQKTISTVQKILSEVKTEIEQLKATEDPDSDQLDSLDMLIRSQNSVYSLIAYGLSDVFSNNDIGSEIDPLILQVLLEAQRCYDGQAKKLAFHTISQFGIRAKTGLLSVLSSKTTAEVRQYAITHLGNLKDRKLVGIFTQILATKEAPTQVLYATIVALEKIGTTKIVPALKIAIQTNSAIVRMHAAKLVHQLNAKSAIADLMYLLADSDSYAKSAATRALKRIGQSAIPHLVQTLDQDGKNIVGASVGEHQFIANAFIDDTRVNNRRNIVQQSVLQILGELKNKSVIDNLIQLLANDELKGAAQNALISMGRVAVPKLIQTSQNENANSTIRIESARTLLSIKDLRATEPLIDLLLNINTPKEIQGIATQFIGNTLSRGRDLRGIEALGYALGLDDTTATQAAIALGKIKIKDNPTVNSQLIRTAENVRGVRDAVRKTAINAIGELKLTEAIQPLLRLALNDATSLELRKSSVLALGKIENNVTNSATAIAMLWGVNTRFDDPNKLRRHMKREYRTYANLSDAIDKLGVEWLPNSEHFRKPQYESWGKIKPVPSLIRSEMMVALGKIGKRIRQTDIGQNIVAELIESLHYKNGDERATVRANAAVALGLIGENRSDQNQQVVKALTQSLEEDKQGLVRQAAATALGKVEKSEKVTRILVKALNEDEFESTRTRAVEALATFGKTTSADQELVKVLQKGIGSFEDDKKEVASIQTAVMNALVQDGGDHTALELSKANKGPIANDNEWVKWAIISTLGRLGNPEGFTAVLEEINNSNYRIRKTAVSLIGNFNNRDATSHLLEIVNSEDESKSIRASAIRSLGKLRYEKSIEKMLGFLSDNNVGSEIKQSAITALQAMSVKKAIQPILSLVNDQQSSLELRLIGVEALGYLGNSANESVVTMLTSIFQNETGEIYEATIVALGKLGIGQFSDDFADIVQDRGATPIARQNAALALAELGTSATAAVLAERLIDVTEYDIEIDIDLVRRNYTWETFVVAAQSIDLPSKIDEQITQRVDDSWESDVIRHHSILALGRSRSKLARTKLNQLLQTDNLSAILAVGRSGERQFLSLLTSKIGPGQDKDVRRKAIEAIGLLGDKNALSSLIPILNDVDYEIRLDAIKALANIKDPSTIPALIDQIEKESQADVQTTLVETLVSLNARESMPSIEPLLQTKNAILHFKVAQALYQITGKSYGYGWQ